MIPNVTSSMIKRVDLFERGRVQKVSGSSEAQDGSNHSRMRVATNAIRQ